MSLGEKIQQLRKAGGLSQEQLADSLNVSRQAISKWETDQSSPEIEKILALSKFFSITTDELLGNDAAGNNGATTLQIKEVRKRRFDFSRRFGSLNIFIDSKIILMIFTLLCIIGAGVSVIVNYAINGRITWASYPVISVSLGWLIITPLIFRKYITALCVLTVTVSPFLYLMNKITPAPDWFWKLGLPVAVIGVVVFWVIYLLYRFTKINLWYKAAITLFIAGVVADPAVDVFVNKFLETEPSLISVSSIISAFSCLFVAALLWIFGYMINRAKSA